MIWAAFSLMVFGTLTLCVFQWRVSSLPEYARLKDVVSSLLNILTTSSGVLLAIAITLLYQDRDTHDKAKSLVEAALNEAFQAEVAVKGGLLAAANKNVPANNTNPPPIPGMINVLITKESVTESVDPLTIHLLNTTNEEMQPGIVNYITAAIAGDGTAQLKKYADILGRYVDVLSIETCYFKGKINAKQRHEIIGAVETARAMELLGGMKNFPYRDENAKWVGMAHKLGCVADHPDVPPL